MLTAEIAQERVGRGAALLDEQLPGWAHRINVGALSLIEPCLCILGQIHGNYYGCRERVIGGGRNGAAAFGFDATEEEVDYRTVRREQRRQVYATLQDAWIVAIADRVVPQQPIPQPELVPLALAVGHGGK